MGSGNPEKKKAERLGALLSIISSLLLSIIEDIKLLQQTRYLQANYIIAVRKPKLLQSTRIGYKTVKFLPSNVY